MAKILVLLHCVIMLPAAHVFAQESCSIVCKEHSTGRSIALHRPKPKPSG